MELPEVGVQCNEPTCKQLDFLPLKCKCNKTFCSDHYHKHTMTCVAVKPPQKAVVVGKKGELHGCSEEGCKEMSVIPFVCATCGKSFCVRHRHVIACGVDEDEDRYAAINRANDPMRQFNEAKAAVDKQIDQSILNMKKKAKNAEMISKLQLMRIKNKATGLKGVPIQDRVYFSVRHPRSDKCTPVFVSKSWTVGRAIDVIALECRIPNDNNQSNSLKLRLHKVDDGALICDSTADIVSELLQRQTVADGDALYLEYINH